MNNNDINYFIISRSKAKEFRASLKTRLIYKDEVNNI